MYIWVVRKECVKSVMKLWRTTDMFEARISAGAQEKPPTRAPEKLDAEIKSSRSYDVEGHEKKCVEIYFELVNKTTPKSQHHAGMTINLKKRKMSQ